MACPRCNDTGRVALVQHPVDAFDYRECLGCNAARRIEAATAACQDAVETLPLVIARACRVERGVILYRPGRWGVEVRPVNGGWHASFTHGAPDPAKFAALMLALPARSSEAA